MLLDLTLSLLYLFTLVTAFCISLWTIYFTYTREQRPASRYMFISQSAILSFVILMYVAIALSQTPFGTNLYVRLRFVGMALLPPINLRFALVYSGTSDGRWTRLTMMTFILPAISVLFALFAPIEWWYNGYTIGSYGVITAELVSISNWYLIHSAYSHSLLLLSVYFMIRSGINAIPPYRSQAMIIVLGVVIGTLISIPNLVRSELGVWLNFNALGIAVIVGFYAFALLRYSFMHIVPIAYETIINTMDTAILVLDTQHSIVTLNPAARETMNLGSIDVNGKPILEVYPPFAQLRDAYQSVYQAQDEVPFGDRIYDVHITPLYDQPKNKRIVGRSITWRDITERTQAERERERMITDLEAYSHTVAHDLKNPLHMMMGMNQMLALDLIDASPHIRQYLDMQMQSGQRMRNIIQDLLFLAQVRAQADIVCVPVAMTSMVQNVLQGLEGEIRLSGAVIDVQDTLPEAIGIAPWLEQVWTNYISNALKYGGTPPLVRVRAEPEANDMIRYTVQDNGAGLTEVQRAKLFQQFVRLEPDRATGTGLGLSIVKRIIERLGGKVGVTSEPAAGSLFYFTLPATKHRIT